MLGRVAIVLACALCPALSGAQSVSADRASAEEFFAKYIALESAFDPALADLYSNSAVIRAYRRYPDGTERSMSFSAGQWKALIAQGMPAAESMGDRSTYSNVRISIRGADARIEAHRYSVRKCYTDQRYYMLLQRQSNGEYLIVEEYAETQPESDC
jgi:hypothetical protein